MSVPNIDLGPLPGGKSLLAQCIHPEFWPRLISAGNKINDVDEYNDMSALTTIVVSADIETLEEFLKLGPDLDMPHPGNENKTALHIASGTLSLDAAKLLLCYGANPNAVDDNGRTPKDLLPKDHPRYNELFNHSSVKRAE